MPEALTNGVLDLAAHSGIAVVASATLLQARLARDLPEGLRESSRAHHRRAARHSITRFDPRNSRSTRRMSPRRARLRESGGRRVPPLTEKRVPRPLSARLTAMPEIAVEDALPALDAALEELPNRPAVFSAVAQTRRTVSRQNHRAAPPPVSSAAERETPSRLLNLRQHPRARRNTGSPDRSWNRPFACTSWPAQYFPKKYLEVLRLRMPPYVKSDSDQ